MIEIRFARADYEKAGLSIEQIAEKHGMGVQALRNIAIAQNWRASPIFAYVETDDEALRYQSNAVMQIIEDRALSLVPEIEKASELKNIMDIVKTHREARLGRQPDTVINNNNVVSSGIDALHEKRVNNEQAD